MKVSKEKLKNEIEEIIAYGAAYSEEVDLTTAKVMSAIEPLVIAVENISVKQEIERI